MLLLYLTNKMSLGRAKSLSDGTEVSNNFWIVCKINFGIDGMEWGLYRLINFAQSKKNFLEHFI